MSLRTLFARNTDQSSLVRTAPVTASAEPKTVSDSTGTTSVIQEKLAADDSATPTVADSLLETMASTPSLSRVAVAAAGLLDAKDKRAYEVARQRSKRPNDRRKARAQKPRRCKNCTVCENGKIHQPVRIGAGEVAKGREEAAFADDAEEGHGVLGDGETNNRAGTREVRLEDLVRVAKVRKEKAGDFELIPNVPRVLVLDDFEPNCEHDDDDTWEHIYSSSTSSDEDEKPDTKLPSYADVLLSKH